MEDHEGNADIMTLCQFVKSWLLISILMLLFSTDMMLRINCFYNGRWKLMFQCEYCGLFISLLLGM